VAEAASADGVPDMRPDVVLKDNPAGRAGETDHVLTGPPEFEGTRAVMAAPVVSESEDEEYEMFGALSAALTVMLIVNVDGPAEFVAVTV
jgi:hypothetical protein